MEVRINHEIRDYTESMFFGLSLRQFFFSVLACGAAVGIYLGLKPLLGTETTSWLCIVAAFPFAALGFLKYNGLTAEKFVWAWIRSVLLMPKVLTFGNTNYYYKAFVEDTADTGKRKLFHRRGGRQKRKPVRKHGPHISNKRKSAKRKGDDPY